MTDKQIIVNDLSCDNCPEAQRCQEQRAKKEYAINQVLQDIPSEYANVITRLRQIIPSITRCDYVLEKQLKRKEQECEELKKTAEHWKMEHKEAKAKAEWTYDLVKKRLEQQLDKLKADNEKLEEELSVIQHNCSREGCKYYDDNTFKVFYECKAQKALQLSANSVTTKYCNLLKTLAEIKEIAEGMYDLWINKTKYTDIDNLVKHLLECELNRIRYKLDEISECGVNND